MTLPHKLGFNGFYELWKPSDKITFQRLPSIFIIKENIRYFGLFANESNPRP